MIRASFESDYNNGCLPEILRRLSETNDEKSSGYGFDPYTERAKDRIRKACDMTEAEVHFLVGGTQTNATTIDSLLQGCEGVLSVDTGHINVHESGAVEAFGHKVLVLPGIAGGKMAASQINDYMRKFLADETYPHMVQPYMVYITLPTELGALYSRKELADIYTVCQQYGLRLYVDGGTARLRADGGRQRHRPAVSCTSLRRLPHREARRWERCWAKPWSIPTRAHPNTSSPSSSDTVHCSPRVVSWACSLTRSSRTTSTFASLAMRSTWPKHCERSSPSMACPSASTRQPTSSLSSSPKNRNNSWRKR